MAKRPTMPRRPGTVEEPPLPKRGLARGVFDALRDIAGSFAHGARLDGWFNNSTGLGVAGFDRAAGADFNADGWLDVTTLAGLYHTNDICRTIVSIFPEEALRRPWTFEGQDADDLTAWSEEIQLKQKLRRGCTAGRLFGGALGVLWIEDGKQPWEPLERDTYGNPKPALIRDLTIYDKRSVLRRQRFEQPGDLLFADARIFEVFPPYGGNFQVHRDRVLLFEGVETMTYEREQLAGWWASALQAPFEVIMNFEQGFLSLSNMLTDASQAIVTMSGLIEALTEKDGPNLIMTRAQIMNLQRSVARAVFLDAGDKDGGGKEEFTKVKTDFSNVPEALDRLGNRLAMATRIPVTKLVGQAPAGLNATGDADTRALYEETEVYRGDQVAPHVERCLRIMVPGRGNKAIWPSLWTPTDKEAAETRKSDAAADKVYLDAQVYTPEEVALSRTGPRDIRFDPRLRRPVEAPLSHPAGTAPPKLPPAPAPPTSTKAQVTESPPTLPASTKNQPSTPTDPEKTP